MPKTSNLLLVCIPVLLFGFVKLVSIYTQMCKPGKKVGWEKQYCMGRDREGGALPTVSCLGQTLKLLSSMACPDTAWEMHGGFSFSLQYKFPAGSCSFFPYWTMVAATPQCVFSRRNPRFVCELFYPAGPVSPGEIVVVNGASTERRASVQFSWQEQS